MAELLHEEPRCVTASFYPPAKKGGGVVLEGDIATQVDTLLGILREKTTVLR